MVGRPSVIGFLVLFEAQSWWIVLSSIPVFSSLPFRLGVDWTTIAGQAVGHKLKLLLKVQSKIAADVNLFLTPTFSE